MEVRIAPNKKDILFWEESTADFVPTKSFGICYGPTATERQLMEDWIQILTAFVNDDKEYKFGTTSINQMKVMTPEGKIEIRLDERWEELMKIGSIFAENH